MYDSIAGRDIERELVALVTDQRLALLPWSPLAGGLLSGKFDANKKGPDGARRAAFDFPPVDAERLPRVLDALRAVAAEAELSVARVALAWVLSRPFVTSVIIGAKTQEQLADNLGASGVTLAPEHLARLDEASRLPSEYPGWMVEWQNREPRVKT
jgi:aryl-alcohol dehydrogenase-like predicted oxidoreductase